jgi:hypothetical protein
MRAHRIALAALTAALLAPAALQAQAAPAATADTTIRVDDFMTPEEAAASGIANLTPAQRAAFERWVDRYTALVTRVARREPMGASRQAHHAMPAHHVSHARNAARLAELINGGDFVRLEDGSVWEIYSPDRVATVRWKAGNTVIVRDRNIAINAGRAIFDVLLVNGEAGTSATARFRGHGLPTELETDSP